MTGVGTAVPHRERQKAIAMHTGIATEKPKLLLFLFSNVRYLMLLTGAMRKSRSHAVMLPVVFGPHAMSD
jgi:hypothetical protein